jgi:hypothetical protein
MIYNLYYLCNRGIIMIKKNKKLLLLLMTAVVVASGPKKAEAVSLQTVGKAIVGSGVAVSAAAVTGALAYYYRLQLFVGLNGLEKRLALNGFADIAKVKKSKPVKFKWYQWRNTDDRGWSSAQDIKQNKHAVMDALNSDLQQLVMALEQGIVFNNLIELKKDGEVYHPVSIKKKGQRAEFEMEVYSVVKNSFFQELKELRNYLWLCQGYVKSIKLLPALETALASQRQYRTQDIARFEDVCKLDRPAFNIVKESVLRASELANGNEKEQKALRLFFEVLERYARLYQMDECVGEFMAAKANGQRWSSHERPFSTELQRVRKNFTDIEAVFARMALHKNNMPSMASLQLLRGLVEDRKQLDSSREVILLGVGQTLDDIIENYDRVTAVEMHAQLARLKQVIQAIA